MRSICFTLALVAALAWSSVATAGTVDVVFLVDESGSMSGEHTWISSMVTDLDSGLVNAGVTGNQYAMIGFGRYAATGHGSVSQDPHKHLVGGGDWGTAAQASTAAGTLSATGYNEDGWDAVHFLFDNYTRRAGAVLNVVLITDEDRKVQDASKTYANTLALLTGVDALFNVVVNSSFTSTGAPGSSEILGVDSNGNAFVADGLGGFSSYTGGAFGSASGDASQTKAEYVDMAWATGGAAWDLNKLRAGGLVADSFTDAFVDIKVLETTQAIVPLPAGGMAGLALLGVLGAFRVIRRRRAA